MRTAATLLLAVGLGAAGAARAERAVPAYPFAPAPPALPPPWVFQPWVWEDDANTQDATLALVEGHLSRGLPVGAVIVDSPWEAPGESGYHTFRFDPERYPDPRGMIDALHARGVRVVVWATGNMVPEAPGYAEACRAGFFVRAVGGDDPCPTTSFWKGSGRASHVDFFHPDALAWWSGLLDGALALGVDGFKVDGSDLQLAELGAHVATHAGPRSQDEYSAAFYAAFLARARAHRGTDAAILARPFAEENGVGRFYAPREHCTACWVGDQDRSWEGLGEAVREILASARAGYAVVGSDVGGFRPDPDAPPHPERDARLFVRWAQLGALLPLMEVGGRGEHRPWAFGERALRIYRRFARLHASLAPLFVHLSIAAHRGEGDAVRPLGAGPPGAYLLGDALLVAPPLVDARVQDVPLPPGTWHDFWDPTRVHEGGVTLRAWTPLERVPVFVRQGSVLPLVGPDGDELHLFLGEGELRRTLHLSPERSLEVGAQADAASARVTLSPGPGRFRVRVHRADGRLAAGSVAADGRPVALAPGSGTLRGSPRSDGDPP